MRCGYPRCGREEKRDQQCIFHLQDKTKEEAVEFYRELAQHKKRSEEDPSVEIVDFGGFCYPQGCDFRKEHFKKQASFADAAFSGEAWFAGATFSGDANFDGATFSADAWFDDVTFSGIAWFAGATFSGDAYFSNATVSRDAFLAGATFSEDAYFSNAKFNGAAVFADVTFGGDAVFARATFSELASFFHARCSGDMLFGGAMFKNASFERTVFLGSVDLGARFDGIAVFERAVFQRDTIESSDLCTMLRPTPIQHVFVTSFSGASVGANGEVRFIQPCEHNTRLGAERNFAIDHVSFLDADLSRFNFQDVEWGRYHNRRAVIEEALMGRPPFENATPEQIRQTCARLRANQEKAFRYAEAGDFFMGEMDMRRRSLRDKGWRAFPERFLLWLFSGLSTYGESISRPTLATVVIVLGLAALRLILREPSEWHLYQSSSVEESLARSVASFFQMRSTTLWTDMLERLVSIPILGVLFIALKRKFERRS